MLPRIDAKQSFLLTMLSPSHFPTRLKSERERLGLSQSGLAHKAGVTQADVSRIEAHLHLPNLRKFVRVCNALEVSADSLLK